MKKRFTFMKTLLVAVGLGMGASAWADGSKRVLESENYESATASDWAGPNLTNTLESGDATYGKYVKVLPSGSGNRSAYKTVTFDYTPGSGKTTSAMTAAGYVVEFDMLMSGGNVKDRSESQFIIPTVNPNLATNTTYAGTDYIFSLSQPQRDAATRVTGWMINDLTNATDKTVTLNYSTWYHYKLVVTATSVDYTISHGSTTDATGSKTVTSLPTITGFFGCLGRGSGEIRFDNLEIYDYTEEIVVAAPTFNFVKVSGADRIYTLNNNLGSGTLYYTTSPVDDAPAKGDAAYSSTTDLNKQITYSASGKYHAYVLHTDGTSTSAITTQTVTAGAITLAEPVFKVIGMVKATDGFYYPQVSFSSDNSSKEGTPTATLSVSSPYTFTATGDLTVTASADGYTSSESTFTVSSKYIESNVIDFGALTASDFNASVWTSGTGVPRNYWTERAAAIPADVANRKLTKTSATLGDPDNSAVVEGITITNYNQRVPEFCIGYGMYTPYDAVSGTGNNMNFTVNGAVAEDYVVYNGWNNYGSGTFNTIQAGNATFGLYRYDTMLRTIKVYSPAPANVSVEVSAAGMATYVPAYNLDFSATTLKAYKAKVTEKGVCKLTAVDEVPAGTPVLLIGATESVPVIASAAAVSENDLVAGTGAAVATTDGDYTNMILNVVDEKVGFYFANNKTVAANRAYLHILTTLAPDKADGSRMTMVFGDDTTTGISEKVTVNSEKFATAPVYNLNGQRVAQPTKGLYIVNGKKVVVK